MNPTFDARATAWRLWPGVALALVLVVLRYLLPLAGADREVFDYPVALVGMFGGLGCSAGILVWWMLFSRAPWVDRGLGLVAVIATVALVRVVVHESIAGGMMGMMPVLYAVPLLCLGLVAWAVVAQGTSGTARAAALLVAMFVAALPMTLLRTSGVQGSGAAFHWRWTPTPEERLLASAAQDAPLPTPTPAPPTPNTAVPAAPTEPPAVVSPSPTPESESVTPAAKSTTPPSPSDVDAAAPAGARAEWPGFRGPNRDGVVHGVTIETDWASSPPIELWRRAVGPGWSSFAVHGDALFTQEQRGDDEIVAAYRVSTGAPIWQHRDAVRFWESNGGAGPRATPTLAHGRVYAFGATGVLNALDARTGAVVWSRNVATDTGRRVPDWGFASSPLIVGDAVIVAAAGTLAAYDAADGTPRWRGPSFGGSYSSPHLVTIAGIAQIVLLGGPGAIGVAADTGAVLWQHEWTPGAIVQPAVMANGDLLVNAITGTGGIGTRRLALTPAAGGWQVDTRWTSNGLKPYFNDFVVHDGHAFGFDGSILSCMALDDGARKWKGGRYGNGQLLLLAEQHLLLVISEEGELALVSATPDGYREIARTPALNGKTWNHPVLVGDVLLLRNGEEMAAFRLATATR